MVAKRTKRRITLTATFIGDGSIKKIGKLAVSGGVSPPQIKSNDLSYVIAKEYKGRNGVWNPRDSGPPITGGFQVNITGTAKGYRQLAEYFLALSEIDSRVDDNFHEHVEEVWDAKEKVRFHLIFRKPHKPDNRNR